MIAEEDVKVFVEDCPASPLPHMMATDGEPIPSLKNMPFAVTLYLTMSCNLSCLTCYASAGKKGNNELDSAGWIKITKKLARAGTSYVYLLGGEPLMVPLEHLTAIIKETKENGMRLALSTNGFMLNRNVAKTLKSAGTEQVQLSIDGSTEEVNDFIRGPGSFRAVLKAASNLREAGLDFSTSFTLTSFNHQQAVEFIRLSEELGARAATLIVVQKFGRADERAVPTKQQVADAYTQIIKYKPRIQVVLNGFRFYMNDYYSNGLKTIKSGLSEEARCPAGRSRFVIGPDGGIYGCDLLMMPEFLEGNALTDDLEGIWRKGFKSFRNRENHECRSCPLFPACGGGCPARVYASFRSVSKKDPLCTLSFR